MEEKEEEQQKKRKRLERKKANRKKINNINKKYNIVSQIFSVSLCPSASTHTDGLLKLLLLNIRV